MANSYFIALGGNVGNVYKTFCDVLSKAKSFGEIKAVSNIYKSKPLPTEQGLSQDPYLNAVILFETELAPHDLLASLINIELEFGRDRVKSVYWGPRTIDLDIIFSEKKIIKDYILTIPHPRLYYRDFVLIPIQEIDKNFIDPVTKKSINELVSELRPENHYIEKVFDSHKLSL